MFRLLGVLRLNQSFEMRSVLFGMDSVQHVAYVTYTLPLGLLPHMRTQKYAVLISIPFFLRHVRVLNGIVNYSFNRNGFNGKYKRTSSGSSVVASFHESTFDYRYIFQKFHAELGATDIFSNDR